MFRTMLVEDDPSFRRVVKLYLQSEFPSMHIIETADGVEALKEIDSHPPDLIFMDIKLPGESGLELTRKIKTSNPDTMIAILTGYDLPQSREIASQCKADYFLSKGSIATGEIAAVVRSILLEKGSRINSSIEAIELRRKKKIMPLIRKRKIWWDPVPEASSYGVYVSADQAVFDPPNFRWEATPGIMSKVVTGKAELIIPDEWPEFPKEPGIYHIGVTAKDEAGNESDPFLSQGLFKFVPPPSPSRGGIESL